MIGANEWFKPQPKEAIWHRGEYVECGWFRFEGDLTACIIQFEDHFTWTVDDKHAGFTKTLAQAQTRADQAIYNILMHREAEGGEGS